ncbi:MAG: hypothetical protein JST04_06745 [Bdellovibrionales bacterium]|nr:hypothetical protein [Bdellovibrionales bacterium]
MNLLSKRVFFFLGLVAGLGLTSVAFADESDCTATLKGKECGDASFGADVLGTEAYKACCPSKIGEGSTTSCKNTANQVLPSGYVFEGGGDDANKSPLLNSATGN